MREITRRLISLLLRVKRVMCNMKTESANKTGSMSVTDIQIVPIKPRDGLLAFVSFVLEGAFYVGDIAIHSRLGRDGIRLVYPMRTLPNGAKVTAFRPIREDVAREVEKEVQKAYYSLLTRVEVERTRRGEHHE